MVDPIFGFPDFRSGTAEFAQLGPDTKRMMVTGETFNQFEDIARQGIADLMAANQNDTAPMVNLPQMRGGGLAEAIGAALTNIVQPGAAQQFAQQQYAVRRANAQMAAQEELANQTQEGYLQRRKQEREQLAAKLQSDVQEARVKAKQAIEMFGIEAGEKRAQAAAEAARKAAEADAMANSKWLAEHGLTFETLYKRIQDGMVEEQGPDGRPVLRPMTMAERRSAMDTLGTLQLSAPTDIMRENLSSRIGALDEYLSGIKEAVDVTTETPFLDKIGSQKAPDLVGFERGVTEGAQGTALGLPGPLRGIADLFSNDGAAADFIGGLISTEPLTTPSVMPEQMMFGADFKFGQTSFPTRKNPVTNETLNAFGDALVNIFSIGEAARRGRDNALLLLDKAKEQEAETRR